MGFVFTMSACGRSGISRLGSSPEAGVTTGGGQGGASSSGKTSGQGGTIVITGSGGQGGVSSAGETGSQGGAIVITGSSGQGGVSSSGRILSSGGNVGGQSGTIVSPRVPTSHRPQASSCAGVFAPAEPVNPQYGLCKRHADCTQGTNGRCISSQMGYMAYNYHCSYDTCATDADCDPGRVCYCQEQSARCFLLGNCQTDADCGGGALSYCSLAYGGDCGGYHWYSGFYCHTPKDTCLDDSDCTGEDYCDFDVVDGRWECKSPNMNCVIG
jgi:hypothetical protein